jgi:lysozyme family protein
MNIDQLLEDLLGREGGYVNNPADKGGETNYGITIGTARAHGYAGAMRDLPRSVAVEIYRRIYWLRPRFDEVAQRSERVAAELFDTGVNMGPAVAATFLQRALTELNRGGKDFRDLVVDGKIGANTLAALDAYLKVRSGELGVTVLLRALEGQQCARYMDLATRRPANEAFLFGWIANRIGNGQ